MFDTDTSISQVVVVFFFTGWRWRGELMKRIMAASMFFSLELLILKDSFSVWPTVPFID